MIFIDANVLVYYLDETADKHVEVIKHLQDLVDDQEQVVTSHHVIEEVLYVLSKIDSKADLVQAVQGIGKIPGIILVEPSPHIGFAERYTTLSNKLNMGLNDSLLLQLIIDANITGLFSYDKKFVKKAIELGIEQVA